MTTYEILIQSGKKEGLVEGKKQGLVEGQKTTIENCFKEGLSIELAMKTSGLPIQDVTKIYTNQSK